jgi:hypothetical protein
VFQFLFTFISPVILRWGRAVTLNSYVTNPAGDVPSSLATIGAYWTYFQTVDLATAALAISVEGPRELLPPMPRYF